MTTLSKMQILRLMKRIAINIGRSKILGELVLALLKKTHNVTPTHDFMDRAVRSYPGQDLVIYDDEDGFPSYSDITYCRSERREAYELLDARTQMGKIISLLEKKDFEIGNVAYDGNKNHNGIISPDGKSIKVGCSTVTYEKVEEIYNAMQKIQNNQ